ncbi:hypothetical protein ARAM_003490 [Aspergillus rambellii]|uniref:Hydroxyneurosporene synthase (CrtC) n=1 Tax=Aspergillus rambellii TaxID=308745 RepID=A0A0F8X7D6_9EURO|nr:hypothetical protein ARAM_003490 [Aspergillus rambellii]
MKGFRYLCFALGVHQTLAQAITVPRGPASEPSEVQWTYCEGGLDGPKVVPINSSTWDWWYFDVVQPFTASGEQASVVAVLYTATAGGFQMLSGFAAAGYTSVDLAQVTVTWPNGTQDQYLFNATEAQFATIGDGTSGSYVGTGLSFAGAPDLSAYYVQINSPEQGIFGSLVLQSVAPAHCPCGPATPGQSLQIAPHIGWINAIPDASAAVELAVRGEKLSFVGAGYHDKNWGDQNFLSNVGSWYWGHGHIGPYSIVWFDFLSPQGENYVSSYVAKDDEILVAQCSGITTRPYGENATYPPTAGEGAPTGFQINITLPDGDLHLKATGRYIVAGYSGEPYTRWSGILSGIVDGKNLSGPTIFEQFNFAT